MDHKRVHFVDTNMEQIPLVGNFSLVHKGVQRNMDAVTANIYRGIFAEEANNQAAIPGTAVVISGGITKKVADHGVSRKVIVTGYDVLAWTERSWREWNGKRHWDVTAVVSYHGAVQVYPEGSPTAAAAPEDASLADLKISLAAHLNVPPVTVKGELQV